MPEVTQKSRDDIQKILEIGKVDVGNGTLFGASTKRRASTNKLTLVISTGGSGLTAIQEAINSADQTLDPTYRQFAKFLVIDSDEDAIKGAAQPGITTQYISLAGANKRFLRENRSPFFKNFMPADYNVSKINPNGASQDRMTGKLKLYDVDDMGTNDFIIAQKIQNLFNGDWLPYANLNIDIMILTGISGGNGSGTFMDLAAIARKACHDAAVTGTVTVYGYIMLPDTADRFASSAASKKTLYRNGYAALKELESYMSQSFMPKRVLKVDRPDSSASITMDITTPLLDFPVLISGNYDDAVSMIAETIVNMIADNGGTFTQSSFYSNITTARPIAFSTAEVSYNGILKPYACPEDSHMYCAIGYAKASVPEKIIIPNAIGKICKSFFEVDQTTLAATGTQYRWCDTERKLTASEFDTQIRVLFGFDKTETVAADSLWKKLNHELEIAARLQENEYDIDLNSIIAGDGIDTYREGYQIEVRKTDAIERLNVFIKKLYEDFVFNASNIMKQYGPRALEYLYTGEGNFDAAANKAEDFSDRSIQTMLTRVETELRKRSSEHTEEPQKPEPLGLVAKAKEAVTHEIEHTWKQEFEAAIQKNLYAAVALSISGMGSWKQEAVLKIQNFYECTKRFSDVMDLMRDYYVGAGQTLDLNNINDFINSAGEANGVNLCSDANMVDWVKGQVNNKIVTIKLQDVKDALVDDFIKNTAAWVSDAEGKARKQFDEILSKSCSIGTYAAVNNGFNLSIMDYFDEVLAEVPTEEQQRVIDQTVKGIVARLLQSSKPSLKTETDSFCVTNRIIMIPQRLATGAYGTLVMAAFNQYLTAVGTGTANVYTSSMVDGIVCYQTSVAHALSSLKDLPIWEAAYEETCDSSTHLNNGEYETPFMELTMSQYTEKHHEDYKPVSREMDELCGVGLSWEHYPSINLRAYGNEFNTADSATREAAYRRGIFNARIAKALEWKLIEVEQAGDSYQYYVNLIPDDWNDLSVDGYEEMEKGRYVRGKALFTFLAKQNAHSNRATREPVVLSGSAFFNQPFDFSAIIAAENWTEARVEKERTSYMKRIMRKNTWLYQELLKTMRRFAQIESELAARESIAVEQYRMTTFFDLYLYGVISETENDEDETEWKIRVNTVGATKTLETFDIFTEMNLSGIRASLYQDGLILPMLYPKFLALDMDMDDMIDVRNAYFTSMDKDEAKALLVARRKLLGEFCDKFAEVFNFATSKKNPVDVICSVYGLEKKDRNKAQELYMLYTAAKKKVK